MPQPPEKTVLAYDVPVVIIGAGASGLYAAWLLTQKGVDFAVLEARAKTGGRILSVAATASVESQPVDQAAQALRFDLGPTWYWPEFQPALDQAIRTLGLRTFEQFDSGETLVEQPSGRLAEDPSARGSTLIRRVPGYAMSPKSLRVAGGMQALTDALMQRIHPPRIRLGMTVHQLALTDAGVAVSASNAGQEVVFNAAHVLLAMPPRLVTQTLKFEPALPVDLFNDWNGTPTWMAPHAKYLAVYEYPFWREQGLSGQARSSVGPMVEIHDASSANHPVPSGGAALFGFVGVPATIRSNVTPDRLQALCHDQFVRMFGPQAAKPLFACLKDWALDPRTCTTLDKSTSAQQQGHSHAPDAQPGKSPWQGRITGIASEWSPDFPGYIAGAVDAASRGVARLPG